MSKSKVKNLSNSQVSVEVKIERDRFKSYWEAAHERAAAKIELKGFRPGAAPKNLIEPLINKEAVFQSAAESAIRDSLRELTEENDWQVIDKPEIDVDEKDMDLIYRAKLTLFPKVALGDYKKIAKTANEELAKTITGLSVDEVELQKSIEWLRESRASEIRSPRPAKAGDLVELSVLVSVADKRLPDLDLKKEKLLIGKDSFLPDFDKHVVGRTEGEEFKLEIKAPENFWQKNLAGQAVTCEVKIEAIFERQLPDLNDEFAKSLVPNFQSLEDLKKGVKEGMLEEKKIREEEKSRIKIVTEIAKASKAELPEVMIDRTLNSLLNELQAFAKQSGRTEDKLREELRPKAREDVMKNLVIYEIVKKENLYPTKEELESEKSRRGKRPDGVDEAAYDDYIYGVILNQKALAYLNSINQ